jgi:microcystin-dependent protein
MQSIVSFVSGMIILWSGSVASIPSGWLLCDGTSSTPDLRDRFVVGAGSTYAVGGTGGTADAVVVSHTHVATDAGHTHLQQSNTLLSGGAAAVRNDLNAYQISAGGTTQSGTANITNADPVGSVAGTNQNLPPYYALCYIMKS